MPLNIPTQCARTDPRPEAGIKSELDEESLSDENEIYVQLRLRGLRRGTDQHTVHFPILIANHDGDGDEAARREEEDSPAISQVIDLTQDDPPSQAPRLGTNRAVERNPSIPYHSCLQQVEHSGVLLKAGTTVEFEPRSLQCLHLASFLRIRDIFQDPSSGLVLLRGLPFTRTRNLKGQLPRLRNEVCLILQIDADDPRPDEVQAAVVIRLDHVKKVRDLHLTNADFPLHRYPAECYTSMAEIEEKALLICRWKLRSVYRGCREREKNKAPCEYSLVHLRAEEASKDYYRASDTARLNAWRGGKVHGGSANIQQPTSRDLMADVIDLADGQGGSTALGADGLRYKQPGQRYSFGDMFCGAGGTSCGAKAAGFSLKLSCDHAQSACETYHLNLGLATQQMDIFDFIRDVDDFKCRVDVLHLSPPCQYWSPAHTVEGVNDDANIASLFSCRELVRKIRPRVFTLEQTFGILLPRFESYFNALVCGFTQHNYSLRWKVVDLRTWGLPSPRKRLIIIGSCPGEALPDFPLATHSLAKNPPGGLLRGVTVKQALCRIPADATLNEREYWPRARWRDPWDPDAILQRCITTHGGYGNYHYSGVRDFTLREYATMNGFPVRYEFVAPMIKRQIGNAFPPSVVQHLFKHIRKWLEEQDRIVPIEDETSLLDALEDNAEMVDFETEQEEVKLMRRIPGGDCWANAILIDDGPDPKGGRGSGCLCVDPMQLDRPMSSIDDPNGDIVIVSEKGFVDLTEIESSSGDSDCMEID